MHYKEDMKIKIEIPTDFKIDGKQVENIFKDIEFDANIIYSTTTPCQCQIQILYRHSLHVEEIITPLIEAGLDLLKSIKPASEHEYSTMDFTNSKITKIEDDAGKWENDNRYLLITVDNCRISIDANLVVPPAEYSLTESGMYLLRDLYNLKGFSHDEPDSIKAIEKNYKPIYLGKYNLKFKYDFKLFRGDDLSLLQFQRWPQLIIREGSHKEYIEDENRLEGIIDNIMVLLSYFQNQNIHYTYGRVKKKDSTLEYIQSKESKGFPKPKTSSLKEAGISIYDYLNSCDFEFIIQNSEFVSNTINRFIFSEYLEGESRFMILYNLMEQARNFFIQLSETRGESFVMANDYDFILGKNKTNKYIKEKIKSIGDIVSIPERELFQSNANKKVSFIKKKQMQNQLEEFFTYLEFDLSNYGLDFEELLKIRNTIYHGNTYEGDIESKTLKIRKLVADTIQYVLYNKKGYSEDVSA